MDRRNRAAGWSAGILLAAFLAGCGGGGGPGTTDLGAPDVLEEATPSDVMVEVGAEAVAERPDEAAVEAEAIEEAELPPPCTPGTTCDDYDPCTVDDQCGDDGTCKGTAVSGCDDKLACTTDACTAPDQCTHELKAGFCLVDGKCYKEGEGEDAKPCVSCITLVATDKLTPDDTLACQDGDACTKGDHCVAGKCVAGPVDCDDKNVCTADSCQGGQCVHAPVDGACPGDACVVGGTCQAGKCVGTPVDCNDGNPCTADSCDPIAGCVHAPAAGACDDGNACTVGDKCEAGQCVPGVDRLKCDDSNPCTDDGCVPATGCVYIPNVAPCHAAKCENGNYYPGAACSKGACPDQVAIPCGDGNQCTDDTCDPLVGCLNPDNSNLCAAAKCDGLVHSAAAICAGAACPAQVVTNCDDGNLCTDDACDPAGGCSHTANSRECDDGSVCTEGDVCQPDATCKGTAISCDDGDSCTIDSCDAKAGCTHKLDKRPDCRPQIVIDYPPRGATLNGTKVVTVLGHVVASALQDPLDLLVINGTQVLLDPNDNSFQFPIDSAQGMNPIVADISTVTYGAKDHLVQTYYYSTQWYPIDVQNPVQSMVRDGLMIFLGPQVWDSHGTTTDIAGLMAAYVQNLNLMAMITNPVATGDDGFLCGTHKINIDSISHGPITVDMVPVDPPSGYTDGGLFMTITINSFNAHLSGTYCHISLSGNATADSISVTSTLVVSLDPTTGDPVVHMVGTVAKVNNLSVKLDGAAGFLLNWIIGFFDNTFTTMLQNMLQSQLGPSVENAVASALKGLALNQDFSIPALLPGGSPATLSMRTKFSTIHFDHLGGTLGLYATIVEAQNNTHTVLGSIGRGSTCTDDAGTFAFPMKGQLELGLHDDFFNQIPFGMYWGGAFKFPVGAAQLGSVDLSAYGITDLNLDLDFWLAPILTSCNPAHQLMVQIGDMGMHATMKLLGTPVDMQMYASFAAPAQITSVDATPPATGKQLSIAIGTPTFLDVQIASLSGGLVGAQDTLLALMKDQLLPSIMSSFTGKAFGSFPIPEIDLGAVNPAFAGKKIAIDLQEILRIYGYTVLSGNVK